MAGVNLDGQTLGKKGAATRRRIMKITADALLQTRLRDLRVTDLASRAGTSPATFYLYFPNVEEVVLELALQIVEEALQLHEFVQSDWPQDQLFRYSRKFVTSYFDLWDRHRPVIRIRNSLADEGEERFAEARLNTTMPIIFALAKKIENGNTHIQGKAESGCDLHIVTMASVLVASLERNATIYPTIRNRFGITRARLIDNTSFLVTSTINPNTDFQEQFAKERRRRPKLAADEE